MNIDKVIHEARGLCWHEKQRSITGGKALQLRSWTDACMYCGKYFTKNIDNNTTMHNPDYTSPVAYCELFGWLKTEGRMLTLGSWWFNRTCENFDSFMELSTGDQNALIAEAILDGVLK